MPAGGMTEEQRQQAACWALGTYNRFRRRYPPGTGLDWEALEEASLYGAAKGCASYDPSRGTTPRTWVIASCLYEMRHTAWAMGQSDDDPLSLEALANPLQEPVDPRATTERQVLARIEAEELLRYVGERERRALRLRFWGNLTYEEIGKVLGVKNRRVHQIIREALDRMRAVAAPA